LVSNLLDKFERGSVRRRELVQHLAFLTAAAGGATASAQNALSQNRGLQGSAVSHISLSVSNLQRSVDFYRNTFGLAVLGEDKKLEIVRMGQTRTMVSLRRAAPAGVVDHFAIHVEDFNREAVTAELTARGITPSQNADAGFHVNDPDGYPVQID
jgi:catechol 2,3-dioxygenase-like lactoylglutathione lyase family enzyme